MTLSAFDDKSKPPGEGDLKTTLGDAYGLWQALLRDIDSAFGPLSVEWGFASKSTGWGLRLKGEKRTVLYMTPCHAYFLASFALGEKAVQAAHTSGLPGSVLKVIDEAKKYAEGRGVRLEVRSAGDIRNVEKLAAIKMAH